MDNQSALLNNYKRFPVEFVKGDGFYLYDQNGNTYLDMLSGIAVNGFGHQHPEIVNAVNDQVQKLWHVSNLFESSGQELLAKKLTHLSGLDKAFFCNSGTEANEAAIKFARKYGKGKYHIITALGGFHGRTMGSLSATGQPKLWNGFFPLVHGFTSVEFGNIKAIELAVTPETIAVMLEPIQGESGIIIPSNDYLAAVRQLCDKHGLLLIFDEVQSGMGRTGKVFAHEWAGIKPDIITLAKGLANGLPLGAALCSGAVASSINPGDHGSTFGGNPVSVAAANAVADLLTQDVLNHNLSIGTYFKNELSALKLHEIQEIRAKGLMLGLQLKSGISAREIVSKLLDHHIVAGTSGDSVIRLLPPFIIKKEQVDQFVSALTAVLHSFSHEEVAA